MTSVIKADNLSSGVPLLPASQMGYRLLFAEMLTSQPLPTSVEDTMRKTTVSLAEGAHVALTDEAL